jgi:hypothetical protein
MELACEEVNTQESARGGGRPLGWSGQKPQEDYYRPTQRSAATTRTPQERMSAAVASIRARFGQHVIGLGYLGIRYVLTRVDQCREVALELPGAHGRQGRGDE